MSSASARGVRLGDERGAFTSARVRVTYATYAGVAELADAQDLKSWVPRGACGFDSRPRQLFATMSPASTTGPRGPIERHERFTLAIGGPPCRTKSFVPSAETPSSRKKVDSSML